MTLAMVVLVISAAACSASPAARMLFYGQEEGHQFSVITNSVPADPGHPIVYAEILVCLDRPGNAEIESVRLRASTPNLRVVGFGLRARTYVVGPDGVGTFYDPGIKPGHLADLGFSPADRQLVQVCPGPNQDLATDGKGPGLMVLGIELELTDDHSARADGVTVTYASGGMVRSTTYTTGLILCPGANRQASEDC